MNETIISEHCNIIRGYGANINAEQLKTSFDVFASELKKLEVSNFQCGLIEKLFVTITNIPYWNKRISEYELVTHDLFIILRNNIIIDHFRRIQNGEHVSRNLLSKISMLFHNLVYHIDETNIFAFKQIIFYQPLIDEIGKCLNEIGSSGKYLNDSQILCPIDFLLRTLRFIIRDSNLAEDNLFTEPILFSVVKCLSSQHAIDTIRTLQPSYIQQLSDDQILFLDTMPLFLQWRTDSRGPKPFIEIVRILLPEFTIWMTSCNVNTYAHCSLKVASMIRSLSYFLIRPIESDHMKMISEEFYPDYCKLVVHWSSILSSMLVYYFKQGNIKSNRRTVPQILYSFTLHGNVLSYMKTIPNLISMLLKITDVDDNEIKLNAYRCLGKMMIEEDIKTMANPSKLVAVYINFITNTIDDCHRFERFHSLLESLKNYVHHDQIKIELIKQNILPLLVKCVVETHFDPIKVQLIALEIVYALSFDENACLILKKYQHFLDCIENLADNTNIDKPNLKRAAEGILWNLKSEDKVLPKNILINHLKYDIMISYSHKDKNMCFQIYEQLIKDGFRVWLDRDCLRGSTMVGIAEAIENSEYVLVCMSDRYKQSVYCQSEAHYAFERGCRLIPIIVESNYTPDGWLGIIVSGKIFVDFSKSEFAIAYEKLKNEINQQRKIYLRRLSVESEQNNCTNLKSADTKHIEMSDEFEHDLPTCLNQWTTENVKSFFQRLELAETILPLCQRMDGNNLLQLYEMCLINRESMYQSLKFELNEKCNILLPVSDYVKFLHQMKNYIPPNSTNTQRTHSPFLAFTICDIL